MPLWKNIKNRLGLFRQKITVYNPANRLAGKAVLPTPKLLMDRLVVEENMISDLVVGLPVKNNNKKINYVIQLPIGIMGNGQGNLEDIEVRFIHAAQSGMPLDNNTIRISDAHYPEGMLIRKFVRNESGIFVSFMIPVLPQNGVIQIREIINIASTISLIDIPAMSRDGVRFIAKAQMSLVFLFDIEIRQGDKILCSYDFRLYAFESKDLKDLVEIFMKNVKEKAKDKEENKEISEFKYFYCPAYREIGKDSYTKVVQGDFTAESLNLIRFPKGEPQ